MALAPDATMHLRTHRFMRVFFAARTFFVARRFLPMLAIAAALSNCGDFAGGCNLIGCVNGLTVHLAAVPTGSWRVALLVNGVVQSEQVCATAAQCPEGVHFATDATTGVSIRVTTESGTRTTGYAKLTYVASHPNGAGCLPECSNANVTADVPV
jgi:hypothetical protein